jgi:hypothetical protein
VPGIWLAHTAASVTLGGRVRMMPDLHNALAPALLRNRRIKPVKL